MSQVQEYGLEECVNSFRRLKPGDVLKSFVGTCVKNSRTKAGYKKAEALPYHFIPAFLAKSGWCLFVNDYLTPEQKAAGWGSPQQVDHWKLCVCEISGNGRKDYPLPDWSDCSS